MTVCASRSESNDAVANKPRPFILCFESHRAAAHDGSVWAVKHGKNWVHAREVCVLVPTLTVYRGASAKQPKAFLTGIGVVTRDGDTLRITP